MRTKLTVFFLSKTIVVNFNTGGEVHSKVLVDGDTTSKKVSIELPKEICEHLESAGDYD